MEYKKRGYLLPNGCKNLIDTLPLQPHHASISPSPQPPPAPLPPIIGELSVPEPTSVKNLARLLNQKPFRIMADAMQFGVLATVDQLLDFKIIAKVARKYGFVAKKSP